MFISAQHTAVWDSRWEQCSVYRTRGRHQTIVQNLFAHLQCNSVKANVTVALFPTQRVSMWLCSWAGIHARIVMQNAMNVLQTKQQVKWTMNCWCYTGNIFQCELFKTQEIGAKAMEHFEVDLLKADSGTLHGHLFHSLVNKVKLHFTTYHMQGKNK